MLARNILNLRSQVLRTSPITLSSQIKITDPTLTSLPSPSLHPLTSHSFSSTTTNSKYRGSSSFPPSASDTTRPPENVPLNWSLNGDGVTPLNDTHYLTTTEAIDFAKLPAVDGSILDGTGKVKPDSDSVNEYGVNDDDSCSFEEFDLSSIKVKDLLCDAEPMYVLEGFSPTSLLKASESKSEAPLPGIRVVTNSQVLASELINNYLQTRLPSDDYIPISQPIAIFALIPNITSTDPKDTIDFCGYAIEEGDEGELLSSMVVSGKYATAGRCVAGIEMTLKTFEEEA